MNVLVSPMPFKKLGEIVRDNWGLREVELSVLGGTSRNVDDV